MLIRNSLRYGAAAPVVYDVDAAAYFAAMSVQPDGTRKGLINTLVLGLKADAVWASLDWLCLMAAHDEQAGRVNAKQPAKSLTAVNSPTFTLDRGFAADGSTSYLTFNENPSAAGNNYVSGSAHLGAYCNQDNSVTTSRVHIGLLGLATARMAARSDGSATQYRLNDSTDTVLEAAALSKLGHRTISRTAGAKTSYLNGIAAGAAAVASSGAPASNIVTHQSNGTSFSADRLAGVHTGIGLSAADALNLYNRLLTYFTAIGAN